LKARGDDMKISSKLFVGLTAIFILVIYFSIYNYLSGYYYDENQKTYLQICKTYGTKRTVVYCGVAGMIINENTTKDELINFIKSCDGKFNVGETWECKESYIIPVRRGI
jgi:hypothetical protein